MESVEGKDEPKAEARGQEQEFDQKNVGFLLVLWLTKNIWGTAKVVLLVLDSGFCCVLQGIVESKESGVFVAALFKKHRYWPK
jgi:hypothetical protein